MTTDTKVTWRVALLAAIAGLLGAIIGAGGSYVVARQGVISAKEETRRSEKRTAYATFLTAASNVGAELESDRLLYGSKIPQIERQHIESDFAALLAPLVAVLFAGSREAFNKANAVRTALLNHREVILNGQGTKESYQKYIDATTAYALAVKGEL